MTLRVVFDRHLIDGPIDHNTWWVNVLNTRYNGAAPASVSGKVVTCPMGAGIPAMNSGVANYEPPPFDVRSRTGEPAAAFADFPLVIVP